MAEGDHALWEDEPMAKYQSIRAWIVHYLICDVMTCSSSMWKLMRAIAHQSPQANSWAASLCASASRSSCLILFYLSTYLQCTSCHFQHCPQVVAPSHWNDRFPMSMRRSQVVLPPDTLHNLSWPGELWTVEFYSHSHSFDSLSNFTLHECGLPGQQSTVTQKGRVWWLLFGWCTPKNICRSQMVLAQIQPFQWEECPSHCKILSS